MKMIEVLNMMAKGEIKEGTKLITDDDLDDYAYRYSEVYQTFMDRYMNRVEHDFDMDKDFLNLEVELIPPKPKKYYLRLDGDDKLSYINLNKYASYEIAGKNEYVGYKTKFAQEEIDENMLLKFIEKHGIKEEVEECD